MVSDTALLHLASGAPAGLIIGIFVTVGLLALIVAGISAAAERRRDREMAQLAASMGFEYQAKAQWLLDRLGGCHLFTLGHGKKVTRLARTEEGGLETCLFDYRYTVGGGKNSRTYRRSVAAFHLPGAAVPRFEMRPEHLRHKLASVFGYQDIDFAQAPGFSSRYLVRGPNEAAVRRLFTAEAIAQFQHLPDWCAEGNGQWIVFYPDRSRLPVAELSGFFDRAVAVVAPFYNASRLPGSRADSP
ncbi:MAG: hypothetical protein BIFFINMI_03005 [Phycisphaerae bacterium]|nr:hypothetical protein [Phycisphaerae bacterium]